MNTCPTELRRLYRDNRIIPFVGAGASMGVTWGDSQRGPSWEELVTQAARFLGATYPELLRVRGTDLQILEYFTLCNNGTLAPLTNWLSQRFATATDTDILRCPLHQELTKLKKCQVFYTTNYDDFIERALESSGRQVKVVTSEHNISHDRSLAEVVKFHGDFNSPNQMVVTESQYMERMNLENPMDLKLRADMLGRALLFVGYSFRDSNVNYIFHLVNRLFSSLPDSYSGRRAYILIPEPSEFERKLFHARNIEVIALRGDDVTKEAANLLEAMRA